MTNICVICHEAVNSNLDAGPVYALTVERPSRYETVFFCTNEHGREYLRLEANNA